MRFLLSRWIKTVFFPQKVFSYVNSEDSGQKHALYFFLVISLIYKAMDYIFIQQREPVEVVGLSILVILISPVVLHISTAIQYLLLWVITEEDSGVDRTLRAIAYGSAPAVVAWTPYLGAICFYGVYIQYRGIKEGHSLSGFHALIISLPVSVPLYGFVFGGFNSLSDIYGLLIAL